jgi:hypothetical protein
MLYELFSIYFKNFGQLNCSSNRTSTPRITENIGLIQSKSQYYMVFLRYFEAS